MKKINFIFCIHNHQPVGNFDHVLEEAYEKSYRPFLEVLQKHPSIKVVLHFSGSLLMWLVEKKKDYIANVRQLVSQGRIEIISSGFFEPVLAVLPEADRIGQVTRFNRKLEEITGYAPRGAWLTERIYEPHLPKSLNRAGIEYIVVDDYHFIKAGIKEENLYGCYATEDEGYTIRIFPGSEKLRYLIPFKDVNETLGYFRTIAESPSGNLAIFADDGEKFGSWPNTYEWVYENKWLDNFFGMLEKNKDLVETVTFKQYAEQNEILGRVYLPTCSYMEMGEWSLPADTAVMYENAVKFANQTGNQDLKRFLKGGIWRNYFAKYPESNNMHKKMLYVSGNIHEHNKSKDDDPDDMPGYLTELYKAQCNDGYWHGIFGGLYLPHLRDAIYRNLINAEKLLDEARKRETPYLDIKCFDMNKDCTDEIIVETESYNMYLQPGEGGTIYEFDYKPASFNIMNTLTRRKEAYHNKILQAKASQSANKVKTIHEMNLAKEEGLEKLLIFDRYNKVSLIDHFIDNISLEHFRSGNYNERGDFVGKKYDYRMTKMENGARVELSRRSFVNQGSARIDVELKKVLTFEKGGADIMMDYIIKNLSDEELTTVFGVEFNMMLLSPNDGNRYFEVPGHSLHQNNMASAGELYDIGQIRMVDRYFNFDVCFDFPHKCNLYRLPVETVSISEEGYERIFQASSLLFFRMLSLIKDDEFTFPIKYSVKNL